MVLRSGQVVGPYPPFSRGHTPLSPFRDTVVFHPPCGPPNPLPNNATHATNQPNLLIAWHVYDSYKTMNRSGIRIRRMRGRRVDLADRKWMGTGRCRRRWMPCISCLRCLHGQVSARLIREKILKRSGPISRATSVYNTAVDAFRRYSRTPEIRDATGLTRRWPFPPRLVSTGVRVLYLFPTADDVSR